MIEYHEKAVDDFDVVVKKNPKNAHAYFRRAFSLKALKKYAEAAEDFEQAKNLDPMNPKLVVNYKKLKGVGCIVLCEPGEERVFIWTLLSLSFNVTNVWKATSCKYTLSPYLDNMTKAISEHPTRS